MLNPAESGISQTSVVFMGVCNTNDGFRVHDFIEWMLPVMMFLIVIGSSIFIMLGGMWGMYKITTKNK